MACSALDGPLSGRLHLRTAGYHDGNLGLSPRIVHDIEQAERIAFDSNVIMLQY